MRFRNHEFQTKHLVVVTEVNPRRKFRSVSSESGPDDAVFEKSLPGRMYDTTPLTLRFPV